MGVHGLWDLLSPVGRRVSVETLAGKRLAIDASIWMIQFMKAMRDERGDMVRNAHILGFFRRICKLLFLRTKPVFVFDGGTPALKRRTVIARRRQRENAQAKIRKTAEKLLLNHLKAMRLKELANDLENQRKNNGDKGKRVITDHAELAGTTSNTNSSDTKGFDQEALDAMLAASIEAEEGECFIGDASTSDAGVLAEDEDGDDDEEMLLPTLQGKVDPAVLAALPPSMQLDLLVQMRERLMAENRQKYQKVKKAPARFSELQIEAYLKTVAFRREIDEVQKAAGGRGIGGVKTSRIASEANREFIFSSSFTGNRQSLASAGVEANSNVPSQIATRHPSTGSVNSVGSTSKSNSAIESIMNEPRKAFNEDVETYRDERGRVRVSKVRAMGIHMTRDLQRNLDLMKEIEQDRIDPCRKSNDRISHCKATAFTSTLPESSKLPGTSHQDRSVCSNETNQESIPVSGTSIEVSFEDDNEQQFVDSDDDIFACIAAGDPLVASSADNTSSAKQPAITLSDCEWEEGMLGDTKGKKLLAGRSTSDESEVEWEEGPSDNPELGTACEVECRETVSKGDLLEEADFQEAIRRSMDDMGCQKDIDASSAPEESKDDKNMATECAVFAPGYLEKDRAAPRLPSESVPPNKPSVEIVAGVHNGVDSMDETKIKKANSSPTTQLEVTTSDDPSLMEVRMETSYQSDLKYHPELSIREASDDRNSQGETEHVDAINPTKENEIESSIELHEDICRGNSETRINSNSFSCTTTHISNSPDVGMPDAPPADAQQSQLKALVIDHISETAESKETVVNESKNDFDIALKVTEERDSNAFYEQREDDVNKLVLTDMSEEQVEITKASLEEEMTNLTKERTDLGDEQRRLERNAESVSGEMFAECQELLQMFGLPYIIAPMEAEAQCAYMELENLVDGVVTDDSDVLLFGARSVYKNIFDDRKYVETYFMKDIETELGLTRDKLIRMAMLLGSDYTEGISGIGIVNATEVLNAFPEEDGLQKFREWIESPDPTILGKASSTRKRGSNSNVEETSTVNEGVISSDDDIHKMKQIFMDKHRNVSKNWHIPSTFPSDAVISAYASPQVDKSTEPFSWGKPDLFVLRKLCWEKFGWGTQKADELLQPVLKEYNKHETQLRLEAFYTFNERFAKIRSKRISRAVKGIAGNKTSELMDYDASSGKKVKHEEDVAKEKLTTRREKSELSTQEGKKKNTKEASSIGGRGRGQSVGKRRRKKTNNLGTSSDDDGNNSDYLQEVHAEHSKGGHELRKSKRVRKSVISSSTNNEDTEMDEAREVGVNGEPPEERLVSDKLWCQEEEGGPVTQEYLKMGGGFCMDEEGDKGIMLDEASISPNDMVVNEEDDQDGMKPATYLSAIPNLRRKRKKV